jgi:hypothetical protein
MDTGIFPLRLLIKGICQTVSPDLSVKYSADWENPYSSEGIFFDDF